MDELTQLDMAKSNQERKTNTCAAADWDWNGAFTLAALPCIVTAQHIYKTLNPRYRKAAGASFHGS